MKASEWLIVALVAWLIWAGLGGGGIVPLPPAPIPGGKYRVVIVEETTDRTKATATVLAGTRWREYVKGKSGEWRMFDDDIPEVEWKFTKEPWVSAFKRAKDDSKGKLPWVIASNGVDRGVSMPLPATEDAFLAELQEVGGDK